MLVECGCLSPTRKRTEQASCVTVQHNGKVPRADVGDVLVKCLDEQTNVPRLLAAIRMRMIAWVGKRQIGVIDAELF